MKKKLFFSLALFIIVFGSLAILFFKKDSETKDIPVEVEIKKIKIAACPTCFEILQEVGLDSAKYEIIETLSTAQSVGLLSSGEADMIVAGRTLKPNEPSAEFLILDDGYAFLSQVAKTIYLDELRDYNVYTDLDKDELKMIFGLENIWQVDNVYEYIDKGVVITTWENTDYSRADLIHLVDSDGRRVRLSRQPTIYCAKACDSNALEIYNLNKINNK